MQQPINSQCLAACPVHSQAELVVPGRGLVPVDLVPVHALGRVRAPEPLEQLAHVLVPGHEHVPVLMSVACP